MITKNDLRDYDFNSIMGYYDYICESKINGESHQAINLMADLSKPQKVDFINYLNNVRKDEWLMNEILKLLKK